MELLEKDTAEIPMEIFSPISNGYYCTRMAKMAFDIRKERYTYQPSCGTGPPNCNAYLLYIDSAAFQVSP